MRTVELEDELAALLEQEKPLDQAARETIVMGLFRRVGGRAGIHRLAAAVVVADASVLIALDQIGQLSLLQKLFGVLLVPPAVAREVAPSLRQLPSWVQTRPLERPPDARVKILTRPR